MKRNSGGNPSRPMIDVTDLDSGGGITELSTRPVVNYQINILPVVVSPGDKIVVKCPDDLPADNVASLYEQLHREFPENKIVVFSGDLQVTVEPYHTSVDNSEEEGVCTCGKTCKNES